MSSASQPRQFPFTNDVGHEYHAPEKPAIHQEIPLHQDAPPNPVGVYFGATTLNTQPTPPHFAPNHTPELPRQSSLQRFSIPTRTDSLSSGFPYDPRVYSLISHDEWQLLSNDIVKASALSTSEDIAAWTTGITTGTLSSPFILVFAPVVGYYSGRSVHRKTVVKKVKERLERDGDIRSVLRRWNEMTFMRRGFQAWLELPLDGGEIQFDENPGEKKTKEQKKLEKVLAKRFKIVIIPNAAMDGLMTQENPAYGGSWNQQQMHPQQNSLGEQQVPPVGTLVAEAPGDQYRNPVELHNISATGMRSPPEYQYHAYQPPVELDGSARAEAP